MENQTSSESEAAALIIASVSLNLSHAKFGEGFAERLDGSVGETDVRTMFVHVGPLDQPWLGGPTGGNPGLGGESCGNVLNLGALLEGDAFGCEIRVEGGALPRIFRDAIGLERLQPEGLPRRFLNQRRSLRPDVLVVVEVTMQPDGDRAHVGDASGLAGAQEPFAGAREKNDGNNADNNDCSEDF